MRLKLKNDFNPRSREGSDHTVLAKNCLNKDFNPRSREGSDEESVYSYHVSRISIHAPAKGATLSLTEVICPLNISIHAPAKGATLSYAHDSIVSRISIHAPAKGATGKNTALLTEF